MALPAQVDTLDEIEEALRPHFSKNEEDGKYYPTITPVAGYALENIDGLKTALGTTRRERDALDRKLKEWGDLDPSAARDALATAEKFKTFDPKADADKAAQEKFEGWQKQVNSEWEAKYAPLADENKTLRNQAAQLLLTRDAGRVMAELEGNPTLLMPIIEKSVQYKTDSIDGLGYEVVDAQGNARIGDTHGNPMTLEQLVQELRKDERYGGAFNGTGKSGSGSAPEIRPGQIPTNLKRSEMSEEAKAKFVSEHGLNAFQDIPS